MRQISLIIFLSVITCKSFLYSCSPPEDITVILENLFVRLVNSRDDTEKLKINDSVRLIIDNYAASDSVFPHRFNNLPHLGQIVSSDKKVKIINWNLVLNENNSRYFCYIIYKQPQNKANRIFRLEGEYREETIRTDIVYTDTDWYGALYYDIRPFRRRNEEYWIILGLDYGNPLITRKIIDVLSFSTDGKMRLGKMWFASEEGTKSRVVLEFASDAVMSLRFADARSIVFDHLVPLSPLMEGNRQFYAPDYSFDAYNFEDGMWKLKINVDVRNRKN